MTEATFSKPKLHQPDPWASWLLRSDRMTPWMLAIGCGGAVALIYLGAAVLSGTLWLKSGQGLMQDWLPWLWVGIFNPVVAGYYLWTLTAIGDLIEHLEKSNIVDVDPVKLSQVTRVYQQRWRIYLAAAIAACQCVIFFITRSDLNNWVSTALLPKLAGTVVTFPIVYMGTLLVLNLIQNIWILHELFRQKPLKINPWHPDRSGGLRPLSEYSIKTAYLVAILGVMVGLIQYQLISQGLGARYSWMQMGILFLYGGLSIVCFFGPLFAAHNGMKAAKEGDLRKISQQFKREYDQLQKTLDSEASVLQAGSEKIAELQKLYDLTEQFPIWPFDFKTLRRYVLAAATPAAPLVLNVLQDVGLKLLKSGILPWGGGS